MAHAGGGGSAGRGFGGSRWGRSGSGGHEKLPVHVSDAPSFLLGTRGPAGRRPSVRLRLGLLSAQSGPGDPTSLPWNPSVIPAAPRFPLTLHSFLPLLDPPGDAADLLDIPQSFLRSLSFPDPAVRSGTPRVLPAGP